MVLCRISFSRTYHVTLCNYTMLVAMMTVDAISEVHDRCSADSVHSQNPPALRIRDSAKHLS